MNINKWIEIKNKEYEKENPPDFITHLNYIIYLNNASADLGAKHNFTVKETIKESKILQKKIHLIKLIIKNLKEENKTIKTNLGFAEVCVPWIAVKTYYLIFNLFLILEYLIYGQESYFLNSTHKGLIKKIKNHIERGEIFFTKDIFNSNFKCSDIMSLKIKSGTNLKIVNANSGDIINLLLKKLVSYKIEEFQREEKIENYRLKKSRQKKIHFLENNTINLLEFFYYYRIKSNYRDLEFLDKDIHENQFVNFYQNYLETAINFYNSIRMVINSLAKVRLEKEIL